MFEVPDSLDIQGHRGARGLKPENTLPSFETALDLRVDTLELDLHLTGDGEVVVWHDPRVSPEKCRIKPAETRRIARSTASELKNLKCNLNPDPERFPQQDSGPTEMADDDYHIVTLGELFAFVDRYARSEAKTEAQRKNAATVRLNIETKRKSDHPEYIGDGFDGTSPGTFEREVVRVVRKHGLVDRVTVQSFEHASVWAMRELEPDLRFAVLEGERGGALSEYADRGAHIWSPRARLVTAETVAEAQEARLDVIPWTVNEVDEMRRLIDLGVDGIISDRPDRLVEIRNAD